MEDEKNEGIDDIELTSQQIAGWEEYRNALYIQKSKSDDLFEKAITFIASGALGLTLTFHDKIVPVEHASCVILIALGWAVLVASLFVNLFSHYQSSKSTDNCIDEIDDIMDSKSTYFIFHKNLSIRNRRIDNLNKASMILLGSGLLLIIIYVSINIHYGKKTHSEDKNEYTRSTTKQNEQSNSERTVDSTSNFSIE